MKITITLKKDANPQVVLNNLYKHTDFQVNYGIIFLMLDGLIPRTLCLKDIISKYVDYQKEVIIRRTKFDLAKDEKRVHILEGYKIAQNNIDEVVRIIKSAKSDLEAKENLMNRFGLSEIQTEAILELKLRRLTGLERDKIQNELDTLLKEIEELKSVLASTAKVLEIIKNELLEIKNRYSDPRKTDIDMTSIDYIEDESLIPVEDIIITLTNKGYIKRINSENYRSQNRGGVGIKGMTTNEEDFAQHLISMTTHDYIMFFTNKGKVYRMKGYEIPEFTRQSKGLPIINLLPLDKEEQITEMMMTSQQEENHHIVFCTQSGLVKRTRLSEFENIRKNGKIAITLKEEDILIAAKKTDGTKEILICSSNGRMVRFDENEIRIMGRTAAGIKGISMSNEKCVGCEISDESADVLVVTENGYGKCTNVGEYRKTHRGSKGVKALNITEKNGSIISFKSVSRVNDLMIITSNGIIIRLPINQISKTGRVAQGVKLINLKEEQKVSAIAILEHVEETNEE